MSHFHHSPDFLIVGAPRSGTTWLLRNLERHEEICFAHSSGKHSTGDIQFFNLDFEEGRENFSKGLDWYYAQFQHCGKDPIRGEKSAHYLSDSKAPELIHEHTEASKIIICIRDPVERAYSHFLHDRHNLPHKDFHTQAKDTNNEHWNRILQAGRYFHHYQRYAKLFGEENILIILNDDISSKPKAVLESVCDFLGVATNAEFSRSDQRINASTQDKTTALIFEVSKNLKKKHPGIFMALKKSPAARIAEWYVGRKRGLGGGEMEAQVSEPKIDPDSQRWLQNYYRAEIRCISRTLGRDLENEWWGKHSAELDQKA